MGMDDGIPRRQVEKLTEMSLSERRDRLTELGDLLSSESPYVRSHAMELVVELSEVYPEDIDTILEPVAEQLGEDALKVDAARTISNLAAEQPAAVVERLPLLVAVIDSGGPVTEHLTDALVSIGETNPDALAQRGILTELFALLEADSAVVRTNVAKVLGDIAETEPGLVAKAGDTFRERLDDSSPAVQRNAAYTLGRIGETSLDIVFDALEELCRLLESPDADVRAGAAYALSVVSLATDSVDDEAMESLLERVRSDRPSVRQHAAFVLAEVAADDPEAVVPDAQRLTRATADSDPQVRRNLVRALTLLETEFPDDIEAARSQVSQEFETVDPVAASSDITVAQLQGLANEETAPDELRQAAREAVVSAGREDAVHGTATDNDVGSTQSPTDHGQAKGEDPEGKTCSNCGEQFGSDADFCSVCGMSLE